MQSARIFGVGLAVWLGLFGVSTGAWAENYLEGKRYSEQALLREGKVAVFLEHPLQGQGKQAGPFYLERDRLRQLEYFRLLLDEHGGGNGRPGVEFQEGVLSRVTLPVSLSTFHKIMNQIYLGAFDKDCTAGGGIEFLKEANYLQDSQLQQTAVANILGCPNGLESIELLAGVVGFLSDHVTLYSKQQFQTLEGELVAKVGDTIRMSPAKVAEKRALAAQIKALVDPVFKGLSPEAVAKIRWALEVQVMVVSRSDEISRRRFRAEQRAEGLALYNGAKAFADGKILEANQGGERSVLIFVAELGLKSVFRKLPVSGSSAMVSWSMGRYPGYSASVLAARKFLWHLRLRGLKVEFRDNYARRSDRTLYEPCLILSW